MRAWLVTVLVTAGCIEAPSWTEACDCADEEVCVEEATGFACASAPAECDAVFAECDETAEIQADCVVALCGGVSGEWSFEWDCHKNGKGIRRFADCTQAQNPVE